MIDIGLRYGRGGGRGGVVREVWGRKQSEGGKGERDEGKGREGREG